MRSLASMASGVLSASTFMSTLFILPVWNSAMRSIAVIHSLGSSSFRFSSKSLSPSGFLGLGMSAFSDMRRNDAFVMLSFSLFGVPFSRPPSRPRPSFFCLPMYDFVSLMLIYNALILFVVKK